MPSNAVTNPDPGNNANYCVHVPGGWSIGSPYYRTPVGEFENSESPYGTFDQGGNVYEWNEAVLGGWDRGIRGGSCSIDYALDAPFRGYNTPADETSDLGSCIAEVPEPASMALLAVGGLVALRRRR